MVSRQSRQPPRQPPRMSWLEAEEELRRYIREDQEAGGIEINVPGGIYGGRGIFDEVLVDSLGEHGGGLFHGVVADSQPGCVTMFRMTDRCLTDFGPAFPGYIAPGLRLICSWLQNRALPILALDFSEASLKDEDLETLVNLFDSLETSFGTGHPERLTASCVPERIILNRNNITEEGAVEFIEVLAWFLMEIHAAGSESRHTILDIRFNWITNLDAFRQALAAKLEHSEELRRTWRPNSIREFLMVGVYEHEQEIPMSRSDPTQAKLSILAGPSWSVPNGLLYYNNTTNRDKQPWDLFMAGPSSRLAAVLEDWQWVRWACPLCPEHGDINEHGAQQRCPDATFGGVLRSHLRGNDHRKSNILWQMRVSPDQAIEEFVNEATQQSYYFNWFSGAQGWSRRDAEERPLMLTDQRPAPPPPSIPPPSAEPPPGPRLGITPHMQMEPAQPSVPTEPTRTQAPQEVTQMASATGHQAEDGTSLF